MRVIMLLICGAALILIGSFGVSKGTSDAVESSAEEELSEMCSAISGVGECRVMISYEGESVYAVAVICDGGDSVDVKRSVSELISSLYGIGYNRISVLKSSDK